MESFPLDKDCLRKTLYQTTHYYIQTKRKRKECARGGKSTFIHKTPIEEEKEKKDNFFSAWLIISITKHIMSDKKQTPQIEEKDHSQKVLVTLPPALAKKLQDRADAELRSLSNMVAYMLNQQSNIQG
jgi:hypothetical protein